MSRRQACTWLFLTAVTVGAAWLLGKVGFPAPQMILALLAGAVLALIGRLPAPLPANVSLGTQAMLGVLMGSYLQVKLLARIGWAIVPVTAVAAGSLVASCAAAYVFARVTKVDLATSTLGMIAGGSAAVVAAADEAGADSRIVAFMQYLRVGIVVLTAPLVATLIRDGDLTADGPHLDGHAAVDAALPGWVMVGRGDQVAGLSIAIVLAIAGIWLGRRLRLPNAPLIGPMLITAVLTTTGVTHGFAPTNLFRDVLFVLIGFEVGARFTKPVVRQMFRLIPAMVAAIVALCAIVGGVAAVVSVLAGLEYSDVYLATTPGGINAVLGIAESLNGDLTLIAGAQSLRLFAMVLALPLVLRLLRDREPRAEPEAECPVIAEANATVPEQR